MTQDHVLSPPRHDVPVGSLTQQVDDTVLSGILPVRVDLLLNITLDFFCNKSSLLYITFLSFNSVSSSLREEDRYVKVGGKETPLPYY